MVRQVRDRLRRHPFQAAVDLPPLFARLGLATVAFAIAFDPAVSTLVPVWPFGVLLVIGLFTRVATVATVLGALKALSVALTPANVLLTLGIAALARRIRTQGSGPLAVDPLPWRDWFPRVDWDRLATLGRRLVKTRAGYYEQYSAFSLRLPLAFVLMPVGLSFVLGGTFPVALLGVAWMAVGAVVALGLLTPWAALAAAFVFPLAVPATGSTLWFAMAFGGLALAFIDDDRVSLDERLKRRGGLFPRVRREVVLEPAPVRPRR